MDFAATLGSAPHKKTDKWRMNEILDSDSLSQKNREAILRALNDPNVTSAAIYRTLNKMELPIGENSIRRYRTNVLGVTNV